MSMFVVAQFFYFFKKTLYLSSHPEVNMKITVTQLRQIIKEELRRALVEPPIGRDTNSQHIIDVLAANGRPMTKVGIIDAMRRLTHGSEAGYNISMYLGNVGADGEAGNNNNLSLVASGHVEVVGQEGRQLVYRLTELGEEEARM